MSFFQNYLPSNSSNGGSNGHQTLKKSQFYVWFLGARESHGLRGEEFVWPCIRQLAREADRHSPNKLTLQISAKGLKIVQTLPTISKSGKVKMEVMKLVVPAHSLTYSTQGRHPNSDVVGCIMLLFNPETRCPIHVHAYRCDSAETACIMNNTLHVLINRPENQRRIGDVENRLMLKGLLHPRHAKRTHLANLHSDGGDSDDVDGVHSRSGLSGDSLDYASPYHSELGGVHDDEDGAVTTTTDSGDCVTAERLACLHRAVFMELKEKLQSKGPLLLPPKDYSDTLRKVGTLNTSKYEERRAKSRQVIGTLGATNPVFSYCNNNDQRDMYYNFDDNHRNFSNNCHPNDVVDYSRRNNKRLSVALENCDDRYPSALVQSNGRYRFSISDLPVQHDIDRSINNYYGNHGVNRHESVVTYRHDNVVVNSLANCRTQPITRKFGDTVKQKNDAPNMPDIIRHNMPGTTMAQATRKPSSANHRSNSNNWMVRPTKFKSMENLSYGVNYDPSPNTDNGFSAHFNDNSEKSSSASGAQNVWLLPKLVDPFGRKYDQRIKVNNFGDNLDNQRFSQMNNGRYVPSSWYIGPCSGYMI